MNAKRGRRHQPPIEAGFCYRVLAIENSQPPAGHRPCAANRRHQSLPCTAALAGRVCRQCFLLSYNLNFLAACAPALLLCTISGRAGIARIPKAHPKFQPRHRHRMPTLDTGAALRDHRTRPTGATQPPSPPSDIWIGAEAPAYVDRQKVAIAAVRTGSGCGRVRLTVSVSP
ncbi:hypothetical protein GALL_517190 [mine drainage metagenome]|uniref:Uncharacterized protein n=1 Tax=mine drainage metagenome TaxID=410659 RepID=A0A1J5PGM5_9ZZZZ